MTKIFEARIVSIGAQAPKMIGEANILILFGIGIILMGLIMMKRPIVIPFSFLIKKVGIKKSMMKMAIMII